MSVTLEYDHPKSSRRVPLWAGMTLISLAPTWVTHQRCSGDPRGTFDIVSPGRVPAVQKVSHDITYEMWGDIWLLCPHPSKCGGLVPRPPRINAHAHSDEDVIAEPKKKTRKLAALLGRLGCQLIIMKRDPERETAQDDKRVTACMLDTTIICGLQQKICPILGPATADHSFQGNLKGVSSHFRFILNNLSRSPLILLSRSSLISREVFFTICFCLNT